MKQTLALFGFIAMAALSSAGSPVSLLSMGCSGCNRPIPPPTEVQADAPPTLRLFFLSDPRGALEPCGCVKDQPGGIDRLGALISTMKRGARDSLLLSAGSTFYADALIAPEKKVQEDTKSETMATSLGMLGLLAIAPGDADLAQGAVRCNELAARAKGKALAVAREGYAARAVVERGGLKIGVLGVTEDTAPTVDTRNEKVQSELQLLEREGAQVKIVLAAVGRGEAKRIADRNPGLLAIVVGSSGPRKDGSPDAKPIEKVGDTLIVELGHELTSVAVLDLTVRDGSTKFQDATGEENAKRADDLHRKESSLRGAIADLERDKKAGVHTVDAKKNELQEIERALKTLAASPAPKSGSYLRYSTEQVREGAGKDSAIEEALRAYYKRVNEFNKVNFSERRPTKPGKGEASYVGVEACTPCHKEERQVWDKTAHAKAYATLATQYKEFNLDCVSCHVTGYDKPGGSTVTHVEKLKDVQCETCHGPGSLHAANPKVAVPVANPKPEMCTSCHHPPHVHSFDGAEKMNAILGPGHGL